MTKKKDLRCTHHRTPVKAVFSATGWYCPVCKKRVIEAEVDVAEQCEMAVGELGMMDAYCIAKDYLTAFDLERIFGIITEASMKLAVGRCKKVYQNIRWTKKAVADLKYALKIEAS